MPVEVTESPTITAQKVIRELLERGLVTEEQLLSLLGEARHSVTLNDLELRLVSSGLVSVSKLLQLKSLVSGLPALEDGRASPVPRIPARLSAQLGAVVLDRDPTTVAMVEDLPSTLEVLRQALGDFEVWLITAPQFDDLHGLAYGQEEGAKEPLASLGTIYELLDEAVRRRASDIHLSVGARPAVRIDGRLMLLRYEPVPARWLEEQVAKVAGEARMSAWREKMDVDFTFPYGDDRFRVNLGADRMGMTVAARKIQMQIPSMDEIGLPRAVQKLCDLERGMVLVVGPTGSGKSTTLAAMLAHIASTQPRHILTLEDPIEYLIPSGLSIVNQRELNQSFRTFPEGLRQALRQDPDVILVGEMRDLETIRTAITAAETGHLVFGTLHTFDAPSTVARIVSSFPAEEQDQIRAQLSYTLQGVVAQSLVPLANTRGRVAAFEVLLVNPAVANLIRKVDGHAQLRQVMETSVREGMQTKDMHLADLVKRGVVRVEDAEYLAQSKEDFRRRAAA